MIATTSAGSSLWYWTRGTGVVSLVLLTLTLVLGITEVSRWASTHFPRFVTAALHKNVSLLAVVFLGIHIVTAVADGFVPIRWIDAVVPFRSAYKPLLLGLGTVAFDLLIALIVTSLLRQQIGHRTWRAVHWAAYACWPIAFMHGVTIGTDNHTTWMLAVNFGCLAAVGAAVFWRLGPTTLARSRRTRSVARGHA
jgi:methionine sulfoxide reductase heme-binding subunit